MKRKIEIANLNIKGQLVIPKGIRNKLKLDESTPVSLEVYGNSIVVKPIIGVITEKIDHEDLLDRIKGAQGIWSEGDVKSYQKRKKHEYNLAKKKKESW